MTEKKGGQLRQEVAQPESKINPRASAISALLGKGYNSDTQDWSGMLKLVEAGYLNTQDLQRHR